MSNQFNFPVYGTQGGGLVREIKGEYVFIEAPPAHFGLGVGDIMPKDWGVCPANQNAREQMETTMGW